MKKSKKTDECCSPNSSCCKVESMITVDDRGQMVLPKEIREKAGISAGEKLILVTWENEQGVCCISLVKSDQILSMVKESLAPMAKELFHV